MSLGLVDGRNVWRTDVLPALERAEKAGDTVLLLGKGHEKTIERANGENPWDEIVITRDALKRLPKEKIA